MKKFLPFVFPLLALCVVLFLGYRWYATKTNRTEGKISDFGEGVKIEELSQAEIERLKSTPAPSGTPGAKDTKSVDLKGADTAQGQVRYEVKDGRVSFSVIATLPELSTGKYQVWLKQVNGETKKKAFVLELTKSGYMGSAAISADTLPFEVIVTKETKDDDQMEATVLSGTLQKE
jgi:hypothetical protein